MRARLQAARNMGLAALCTALLTACTAGPAGLPAPGDIAIAGTRVFPESITSDSLGTLYVGSNGGTIYRALSGEAAARPWIVPDPDNGLQSVFGVLVDEARGVLWACSNPNGLRDPPERGPARLKAFKLTTGEVSGDYPFPGSGPALCNDIAVGADGTVYATDTSGGRILRLAPNAAELTEFAAGAALRGIDGIAIAGDGTLYINNIQQNLLQRVERADGRFTGLTDIATPLPLSGPDGLRPIGGNRFLQAEGTGGRVALLVIEGERAELTPINVGIDYPASVTLVGRTIYVPEGKISYLFDPAKRAADPGPFTIRAIAMPDGL